jgi:hypothetical protein
MTIELAERAFYDNSADLPPVIGEAAALVREVEEVFPTTDIQRGSHTEAAIAAHHAYFGHTDQVRETLLERFPDDPSRVERLLGRAATIVDELLDDTFVAADSHMVNRFYNSVKSEAISGNLYALRAIGEAVDPDSTGAFRMPTLEEEEASDLVEEGIGGANGDVTAINKYRYAVYDQQVLEKVQKNPLEIELDEAEVVLLAPVLELRGALATGEKATIIPLSAAVRLIIDHVPDLQDTADSLAYVAK